MAEANCRVKRCPKCGDVKPVGEFSRDRTTADGLCTGCKSCKRQQRAQLMCVRGDEIRKKDRDYKRANQHLVKRRRDANLEKFRKYQRDYLRANPDKRAEYRRSHRERHGDKVDQQVRAWQKMRRRTDPVFRMSCAVRHRIWEFMRVRSFTKSSKTLEMLGCSWDEFAMHMQSLFAEGMTLGNYGEWHIDHIMPLASAVSVDDVIRLSHYKNLQPLWAADNRRKSASLPSGA